MCDFVQGMDACTANKIARDGPQSSNVRKPMKHRKRESFSCRQKKKEGYICQADKHVGECPHSDKYSDLSSSDSSGRICRECARDARLKAGGRSEATDQDFDMKSIISLKQEIYIQPRTCPICFTDISYLPKYGTCPKCCYKPTPLIKEVPYNEELTAGDILAEWGPNSTKKRPTASIKNKCDILLENRCKCSAGKICAFCRIQNKCCNILGKTWNEAKLKKECIKTEKDWEICNESDKDERPHLQRVISELTDLYNISREEKVEPTAKDEDCQRLIGGADIVKKKKSTRSVCGVSEIYAPSAKEIRKS